MMKKMINEKRGISPLVATVLLVALIIVIALLVFWWYGELVAIQLEKSDISAGKVCAQDVGFSISLPECSDVENEDEKLLSFSIENNGKVKLSGFRVIAEGNLGSFNQQVAQAVQEGITTKISVLSDVTQHGTLYDLEVIPMINAGGTTKYCNEQSQYVRISCN